MQHKQSLQDWIEQLKAIEKPSQFQSVLSNSSLKKSGIFKDEQVRELTSAALFQVNDFSPVATKQNMQIAKQRVLQIVEGCGEQRPVLSPFAPSIATEIIRRILNNFNLHVEAMYQTKPHGRGHLDEGILKQVHLGNEYDVQHMLYALLKPIFPEVRTEVNDDTGYGGIRYDIVLDSYNVTIEVKCTRENMTGKKLAEEIGADAYHYKKGHIFFFIYDRIKLIQNKRAFIDTYTKGMEEKVLETIVLQPIVLL